MTKEEIKKIRKKSGLTQEQFAEALDVSKSAVVSWEYGVRKPGRRSLLDIERFVEERELEAEE